MGAASSAASSLQDGARARAVGPHHARDLRLCRAGRDLHRPHQPPQQPALLRDDPARPTPAASSRCRPMAPACSARSIWRALVVDPFTATARLDEAELDRLVPLAVRMIDNVIDVSRFPLPAAGAQEAKAKRRIGLGVTGLADALIMCRARYGSEAAVALTEALDAARCSDAAYLASVELAAEKGAFPLFDRDKYLAGETIAALDRGRRGRDRRARHPQRAADLDRADRHDLAARRQRVVGARAGVQLQLHAQRADARRHAPRGRGRATTPSASSAQLFGENAELPDYFVDAQTLSPGDHVGDAGGGAEIRRQLDLQDHQLPGGHLLRGVQGRLPAGLRARLQGLHDLPAERR